MKVFQNPTGVSSEDEQSSKRHARRYRVYLIIVAIWIALIVILATILTPMLVLQHEDTAAEKAFRVEENDLANNFSTEFRGAVLNAISAVYGVQGYIMGEMKSLPNLTASKEERVEGQYFDTFDRYAKLVNSSASSVAVFLTAPGGVTYQFFPKEYGVSLSNWDLLDEDRYGPPGNWSDPAAQRPTSWKSIQTGRLAITGPYNTSSLPFVEHNKTRSTATPPLPSTQQPSSNDSDTWWIDLRQPVYKPTSNALISPSTFWGFAMAALSVNDLLEKNGFVATMHAHDMNYTVYTKTSSKDCVVIVSSWPGVHDCTVPFMRAFINTATVHDVLGDQLAWKVAVKSRLREDRLTGPVRLAIVLTSVLGTLALFAVMVYVIILCTRVYDGSVHAPKAAPFAMLTIGPCRGEELWELASDQMVVVTDRLGKVLAKQMERHHAYQIQQVHPLTTSYVTRSVAAAVQMAFDAIEEVQSSPIDEPLRRLLGDDCGLLLSYAVHWCNDAVVRPEHLEGGYRYEGPDVVYGGRMWVFAAPNVVTVSPTALPAAKRVAHVRYKVFDSVFLRGVAERQDLYVLSNPTNHRLCEAEAFAAEQVRRARQAQREMAEMRSSDADPDKRRLPFAFNPTGYDSSDLDLGSFSGRQRFSGSGPQHTASAAAARRSGPQEGHSSSSMSDHSTPSSGLRSRALAANAVRAATAAAAAVPVGVKREGVVGIAGAPTAIVVPSSTMESPLPHSCSGPVGGVPNPLLMPACSAQDRHIVGRPSGWDATSNDASGSSGNSDDDHEDTCGGNKMAEAFVGSSALEEKTTHRGGGAPQEPKQPPTLTARLQHGGIPYGVCVPALPPIGSLSSQRGAAAAAVVAGGTPSTAASTAPAVVSGVNPAGPSASNSAAAAAENAGTPLSNMSSRRVLDTLYRGSIANAVATSPTTNTTTGTATTSSSLTTVSTGQRHGEAGGLAKPLVMVPPSAELAAAGGLHGVATKASSGTPSSDSTGHGRRAGGGPASSYDNPLAHNLASGPLIGAAGAGGNKSGTNAVIDGSLNNNAASPPLIAMTSFASDGDPLADSRVSLDTFSSDLLLRPAITVQADQLLRTVFDRQAVALDVSYDSVRVLVYYFYSSYKILFRPLAAPERHNIYRRLVTAFGVPQQGILEHLAARCAIRFLQRHEETQTLLWDQQRRLQMHAPSHSGVTTATASTSDDAGRSRSN